LEYVVAFGSYIFSSDNNQLIKGVRDYTGTLEQCENLYSEDKKYLESIIKSKYISHFRNPEASKVQLGSILGKLNTLKNFSDSLDVKTKSTSALSNMKGVLKELITEVREDLAKQVGD
jgi:hypothetical protein